MQIMKRFETVQLTSQVVTIQSLQPKCRAFESTCVCVCVCVCVCLLLFNLFIIDVPRPLRNDSLDHSISKG